MKNIFTKNRLSLLSVAIVISVLIAIRLYYFNEISRIFTWDALGYYLYLPSYFIYHDIAHLSFFSSLSETYHFPGKFYQAHIQPNGNYVFFYSIGTAIMQAPFFFIGHLWAHIAGFPADGFSEPYQLSVAFGLLLYSLLGLLCLRAALMTYFEDWVCALVILLTALATNYPQYTAFEASMTHGYLFALCCFLLLATIKWHQKPSMVWSAIIGFLVSEITVLRVTDAVMILIPVLWNTTTKEDRKKKWDFIVQHKNHWLAVIAGGFLPVMLQLVYWKYTSGSWIYKMGSKWDFLNPHWRVLVGWEKGWFIYTPVTILMIVGLFMMKNKEYKRAIIAYAFFNIWIIISWHHWRYAASYSTRALAQSLPALAFPLAIFIEQRFRDKWRIVWGILFNYLIGVNIFQIHQYNSTVLHYDHMNYQAYRAIYLNPNPSPVDMSMLDTDECPNDEEDLEKLNQFSVDGTYHFDASSDSITSVFVSPIQRLYKDKIKGERWLKISSNVKSEWGAYDMFIGAELSNDSIIKQRMIRMHNGIMDVSKWNPVQFYFTVPQTSVNDTLKIFLKAPRNQMIDVKDFQLEVLVRH